MNDGRFDSERAEMVETTLREVYATARQFGLTQLEILRLIKERPDGWREAIVEQRRAMAAQMAKLGARLTQFTPTPDTRQDYEDVRERFSRLRSAIAEHQAAWPAVSADPSDESFQSSNTKLKALFDELNAVLTHAVHKHRP
jgi:hypothetical protein